MNGPLFEVSVEGVDNVVAAQRSGADRVELCADVLEGGITPSIGCITASLRVATVPVFVIVRPRGGDFCYSETEFECMKHDVIVLRESGAAGIVTGCLTPDGRVDPARTAELVELAGPMDFTFHRAFDMAADMDAAIEALIKARVPRVLTSGQCATALEGLPRLIHLQERYGDRITVMPCGSIRQDNVARILARKRFGELHFAAHKQVRSGMDFRNGAVAMGNATRDREYMKVATDTNVVRATINEGRQAYGH